MSQRYYYPKFQVKDKRGCFRSRAAHSAALTWESRTTAFETRLLLPRRIAMAFHVRGEQLEGARPSGDGEGFDDTGPAEVARIVQRLGGDPVGGDSVIGIHGKQRYTELRVNWAQVPGHALSRREAIGDHVQDGQLVARGEAKGGAVVAFRLRPRVEQTCADDGGIFHWRRTGFARMFGPCMFARIL